MKKIALVTISPVKGVSGGTQKVFFNMAYKLREHGYLVTAIFFDDVIKNYTYKGVDFINLGFGKNVSFKKYGVLSKILAFSFSSKQRKINRMKQDARNFNNISSNIFDDFDVIFVFQPEIWYYLRYLKVKIPIVIMVHGDPATMPFFDLMGKDIDSTVQVLLPIFENEVKEKIAGDVVVVPNVVPSFECTVDYTKKKIIHVGRFCSEKRQDLIVRAFATIKDSFEGWCVELWGGVYDGKYYDEVRKLIKELKCEDVVRICGETNDIEQKLKEASIFVFPSETEGFPLALTEAMSIGLTVVGNKECRAVSALVSNGYNGILCDNDVDSLSSALKKIMVNDCFRKKLGYQAKKDMLKYRSDVVYQKWEDVIHTLTN